MEWSQSASFYDNRGLDVWDIWKMKSERGPAKARFLQIEGMKRGRPKKRWEVVKKDQQLYGLNIQDAQARDKWKRCCRLVNSCKQGKGTKSTLTNG